MFENVEDGQETTDGWKTTDAWLYYMYKLHIELKASGILK